MSVIITPDKAVAKKNPQPKPEKEQPKEKK